MQNNKDNDERVVITSEFPSDEYLLAIGKFIVTFSRLEERVVDITSLLFGCEPEAIANITYALDMRNRCLALRGILAYRFGSREKSDEGSNLKQDDKTKEINRLFKKIQKAIDKRNSLVHSTWHGDANTGLAYKLSPKGKQLTGYPGGNMLLIKISEIEEDIKFVGQVESELWKYFWDNFGDWIQERAKKNEGGLYWIQPENVEDVSPDT